MKIHRRKFETNVSTEWCRKISDGVPDGAPGAWVVYVVGEIQSFVFWIEVSSLGRKDNLWVHELAAEDKSSSSDLGHTVVRSYELRGPDMELHFLFSSLQDFFVLTGFEQLRHVFHYED